MEKADKKIKAAQEKVNQCRKELNKPEVTEFVTMQYKNGFVTMPTEEFDKLTKTKAKRLMKP